MEPLRLLVVEDSSELVQIWRTLFKMVSGYQVKYRNSAAAARELIDSGFSPDVLLTDYYLGDSNGIDLISWSRERVDSKYIIITGSHGDERIMNGHKRGDFVLLHKPVKFSKLCSTIEATYLEHRIEPA